jgi:hypothetical protein
MSLQSQLQEIRLAQRSKFLDKSEEEEDGKTIVLPPVPMTPSLLSRAGGGVIENNLRPIFTSVALSTSLVLPD